MNKNLVSPILITIQLFLTIPGYCGFIETTVLYGVVGAGEQCLMAGTGCTDAGKLVRFEESWSWPKPVQQPRPPVLVGGAPGPKLFAHVAEYGDGWIPIGGAGVAKALPDLQRAVAEAGRDPASVRVVPFGAIPDRNKLDYYASLGIDEVVLRIPSAPADEVMPVLDAYAEFM